MDSSQNSRNYTIDDYYSYIVKGETYSGVASDNGIKLHKVVGKTEQDGEPSPDNKVPIQNVVITEIYSNGEDGTNTDTKTNTVKTSITLAEGDVFENGVVTRKRKKVVFDGSSDTWILNTTWSEGSDYSYYYIISDIKVNLPNFISDRFKCITDKLAFSPNEEAMFKDSVSTTVIYVSILKNRLSSTGGFKEWLQSHPIEFEYELATPTTEELKIPTVPSYNPHTNVWTDNEVPTDMEWEIITSFLQPKTDWQASDYINIEDFNRIRNNIQWLKTLSRELYKEFPFSVALADEVGYSTYSYVELWNSLESCLQDIVDNTTVMTVGTKRTYTVFDPYIDYNELNRLERACLTYYQLFERQKLTLRKLAFKLGANWEVKI